MITAKDFEKIKALFQRAHDEKVSLHSLPKYDDKKDMKADYYMVYSFAALPLLIEKLKQTDSRDILNNQFQIRFVVAEDEECWFALEGRPGDPILYDEAHRTARGVIEQAPAHSDMTPTRTCISSGIIVFSPDYKITRITNFSGHYRPKVGALVWIVDALVKQGAEFTPEVTLGFYWKVRSLLKSKHVSLLKEALHTLLPSVSSVISSAEHRVAVYSNGEWGYFGPGETPQFKEREESATKRRRFLDDLSAVDGHFFSETSVTVQSYSSLSSTDETQAPPQDDNDDLFVSSPVSSPFSFFRESAQPISGFDSPIPSSQEVLLSSKDEEPFSDGELNFR